MNKHSLKYLILLFISFLFNNCSQEEDFLIENATQAYQKKSLWKEDETYITNVKKIYEKTTNIVSTKNIVGNPLWDYALTDNAESASILEVPVFDKGKISSILIVIKKNDKIYFFNGYNQEKIFFYENLINTKTRKSLIISNSPQARRECNLKEVMICAGEGETESCSRSVNLVCVSKPYNIDTCMGVIDPFTGQCEGGGGGDGGYPYPGGGGDDSITLSEVEIKAIIKDKPFAFIDVPCDIIKQWLNTAKHSVSNDIISKLNNISKTFSTTTAYGSISTTNVAKLQDINNAYSTVVNMDYFPITIDKLPPGVTAEQLLNHIRTNINSFIDTDYSYFEPYHWNGINDTDLWNSSNPLGAVIGIDIKGPDNGSVVVTKYSSSGWTFSTIYDPTYLSHPVSGHRDFGFTKNTNGSYTFYTRGVDRLTNWDGEFFQKFGNIPFTQADNLWKSFQNKITNYVNSKGGKANVETSQIKRPDWQTVIDVIVGEKPLSTLSNDCK
ncbi:hypothetical protein [Empedobacter falsenii]